MAEYIERGATLKEVESRIMWGASATEVYEVIQEAPSVDVAQVVRCRECATFDLDNRYPSFGLCWQWEQYTDSNGFCYHGERKDGVRDG